MAEIGAPQYFAVLVEDVETSREWYRVALGLEEMGGSAAADGSWRIENLGNERLHVELIGDDRARPRVVDFEPQGQRILQLRDPDGNVLQLSSPLKVRK